MFQFSDNPALPLQPSPT